MLTGSWIVRLLGKTGSDRRTVKVTRMTQCMVRPCVARRFRRAGGKRSCINVSGLWLEAVLRAIMDISAPATSLADWPRLDHLGHQFLQAPGRPNLHLFSSSRRP